MKKCHGLVREAGWILLCALFDVPTRFVLYIVSTNLQWVPSEMWKSEQVYTGYYLKYKSVLGSIGNVENEQVYTGYHSKCKSVLEVLCEVLYIYIYI